MQYTKPKNNVASQMMWDAGLTSSGSWVTCQCGKDFYERLLDNSTDEYVYYDYIELDGKFFVRECDDCAQLLARYEYFIWNSKDHIRRYLKTRVDQEKAWADQQHLLNQLAGID